MWWFIVFILVVMASGLLVLRLKPENRAFSHLLSFSGAYLFGLIFLHLAPETYEVSGMTAGYFILAGFLIQLGLDYLSKGIEHGHAHYHGHAFPVAIYLGLCLHSYFEGFPTVYMDASGAFAINRDLLIGILIHKIPVAIVLTSLLLQSRNSIGKAMFWLFIFSLTLPVGAFTNFIAEQQVNNSQSYQAAVNGIVIGILLHVATTILYENDKHHRFNSTKFLTILAGLLLAIVLLGTEG